MDESRGLALMAKVLPHMFARWRDPEDFEILAALSDGVVTINVLTGVATHAPAIASSGDAMAGDAQAEAGLLRLRIAQEIRSGLMDQLVLKEIQPSRVREAVLRVRVDTSKVKTDRTRIVHFDFHIASRIHAEAGVFEASQIEEHVWHDRTGGSGGL